MSVSAKLLLTPFLWCWPPACPNSVDKNATPAALALGGDLKAGEPGKPTLGGTPLMPVYHLLDPACDQTNGSWRQLLSPKN